MFRRPSRTAGILLVSLLSSAALASTVDAGLDVPVELRQDGADLVVAGRRYLADGQLAPAVEVLAQAVERDPSDGRAHLQLALALARVRVEHADQVCEWGAWTDRIQQHLRVAWALDAGVLDRVQLEPDLAPIRQALSNSMALRLWPTRGRAWKPTGPPRAVEEAGFPVMRLEGVVKRRPAEALLADLTWYGIDADGTHDDTVLDLRPDGRALRATVERDADSTKHARYTLGSWSLDKDGLHLQLQGEPSELAVTLDGLQAGSGEQAALRFVDRPVDCTRPFDVWAALPPELQEPAAP